MFAKIMSNTKLRKYFLIFSSAFFITKNEGCVKTHANQNIKGLRFVTRSTKLFCRFLLLCLFSHLSAFAAEDDAKDEPAIFTSEQLSALTSDEDGLISQ